MNKWDKYNKKAKFYELIDEKIMETYIKKIFDKILVKYNKVILKRFNDIGNYKLVKYNICFMDKRSIKCK